MEIPESLAMFREPVEQELRAMVAGRGQPLYRMMEYQLGWTDEHGLPTLGVHQERMTGVLCLALCNALGGDPLRAAPAAAAVELAGLFTQVHDDIQDGAPSRGPRPSVWWVWGPAQAINAGDGLHALARLALFRLADRGLAPEAVLEATRVLDTACLDLLEGQHADLELQEQLAIGRERYMAMLERRAGALPGCAAELGALLAPTEGPVRNACRRAGRLLGMAARIAHDVSALWAGGQASPDVLSKRKVLPVVYALESGPLPVKRELGALYMKRVLEPSDMPRLVELLDSTGAREFSMERAREAAAEALRVLEAAPLSGAGRQGLRDLAEAAALGAAAH